MTAIVQNLVTSGTFQLDGGSWDVDNNVWIVGDDSEVLVIDPAHDAAQVAHAVGDRGVAAVLLTHGHDDHIRYAREFADKVGAPVYLHPADQMLWEAIYPGTRPDAEIVYAGKQAAAHTLSQTEINDLTTTLKGNLAKIAEHGKRADGIVKAMLEHAQRT